jgi:rare lipoprotein A
LAISGALSCGIFLGNNAAQARSGLAAYHLHTSAFVTAARYEPRGSLLSVMNPRTGRSILVRVNDRGPFNGNRILDLSTGAFKALFGSLKRGTGPISYQVVNRGSELSGRSGNRYRRARSKSRRHHRRQTSG